MTTDLVAFLLARLAELETAIETEIETGAPLFAPPHQLLADVASKRQLIDRHCEVLELTQYDAEFNEIDPLRLCRQCAVGDSCSHCLDRDFTDAAEPCDELRILASVYVDHPSYREEWKP